MRSNGRSEKVSENLARQILEDVVARDLAAGATLPPEAIMLEQFGVGRASLREALRILEVYGLIRVRPGPGGGPVVASVSSRDFGRTATFYFHAVRAKFVDLLEARLVLEPIMARMAAERLSDADRDRLLTNIETSKEVLDDPGPKWGHAMAEFHGLIAGITGNRVLDLIGSSLNEIHAERVRPMFPVGGRKTVLTAHANIANAILGGDAESAAHLSRRHMEGLVKRLKELDPALVNELIDWH